MRSCTERDSEKKLEFYLLDLLSEEESAAFEEHMLTCDYCAHEVEQFNVESINLLTSNAVRDKLAEIMAQADGSAESKTEPPGARLWFGNRRLWMSFAAVVVILIVALIFPWKFRLEFGDEAIASGTRLAIFSFGNMTTDTTINWEGRAISNLLITDLADSRQVNVIPGQEIFSIQEHLGYSVDSVFDPSSAVVIAREARARWFVIGNIVQDEPTLTVVATVFDVQTLDTVATYIADRGRGKSLFDFVDDLSSAIRHGTGPPYPGKDESDRPVAELSTHSLDAYRHYLKALDQFYMAYFSHAAESFRQALEYDSTMAMAYYYLSLIQDVNPSGDKSDITKAVRYMDRATAREQYYIRFRAAFVIGEFEQATQHLLELCNAYPEESEGYFLLCLIRQGQGRLAEAIEYGRTAVEKNPYHKLAYEALASAYKKMGEDSLALEAIDSYIALAPNEPNPHSVRGDILAMMGRFDESLESFSTALRIDPDFNAARVNGTFVLLILHRFDEAHDHIELLLNSEDREARAWGRTLELSVPVRSGKFNLALKMIDPGIKLDRESDQYLNQLIKQMMKAYLLVELNRYDEALNVLEGNAVLHDRLASGQRFAAHRAKGYVLARMGRTSEAMQLATTLRQNLDKEEAEFCYNYIMGFTELEQSDWNAAIEYFETARQDKNYYFVRYGLARAYLGRGRIKDAIREFESLQGSLTTSRALYAITDVKTYYFLGIAYEERGEYNLAIEQYEQFLNLWGEADIELPEIIDAKERLGRLKDTF